jgi:hypothetical protein
MAAALRCDVYGSKFKPDASPMAGLCPECAHWLYRYANCDHDFVVGRFKHYCRRCGWDGSRSDHVRRLIHGTETDWIEVVAPCPIKEADVRFIAWCEENNLDPIGLAPEDVKQEVGRSVNGGSFASYSVRRSALAGRPHSE